jgi:SAM-dependent methyltransferase
MPPGDGGRPRTPSSGSVAFDPVAADYDRTRALPPRTLGSLVQLLAGELRGRGRILEIGVGTGRIAIPIAGAGVDLIGVDLSPAMLARLRQNAGGRAPFPVAVADATRLPFAADTFGGAFGVHVLHLIPDWRAALAELTRVARPGAVLLFDLGGASSRIGREIRERLEALLGPDAMRNAGLQWGRARLVDAAMSELGATRRLLAPVSYVERTPLAAYLRMIAEGRYSWTWRVPEDARRRAVEAIVPWAEDRFGDLEAPRPARHRIRFRAYDLPG